MSKFPELGDSRVRRVEVTSELVASFAALVSDHAPVHFDEVFAKERGYRTPIAHGMLVTSLLSGVLGEELPGPLSVINELKVKYRSPVFIGDTVQVSITVTKVVAAVGAVLLAVEITNLTTTTVCISGSVLCSFPNNA